MPAAGWPAAFHRWCSLRLRAFSFAHHLTQLNFNALEKLVDAALKPVLFKHQRMAGQNSRQPRITLAKPKNQQHNQTQARCGVFFIFQNQIDARNQAVFDKLDQAVKHAGLAGKWRYSAASDTPTDAASFAVVMR
jgi:hypothetical protein